MPVINNSPYSVLSGVGNDTFTKLLIHSNTTNGSTSATDSSAGGAGSPHTVNMVGGAVHSTARQEFGSSSMFVNGGSEYLASPDSTDYVLGSGDFAIDTWMNLNTVALGTIASQFDGGSQAQKGWTFFYHADDDKLQFSYTTDGTSAPTLVDSGNGSFVATANTWNHVAVARDGANLRFFVNGIQVGSTYNIAGTLIFNSTEDVRIGTLFVDNAPYTPNAIDAYFDEFRLSVGTPRYTSNFTPMTEPYGP